MLPKLYIKPWWDVSRPSLCLSISNRSASGRLFARDTFKWRHFKHRFRQSEPAVDKTSTCPHELAVYAHDQVDHTGSGQPLLLLCDCFHFPFLVQGMCWCDNYFISVIHSIYVIQLQLKKFIQFDSNKEKCLFEWIQKKGEKRYFIFFLVFVKV